MPKTATIAAKDTSTVRTIRSLIEADGERIWRFRDFRDLPLTAVAQSLSRLSRSGFIARVSKGIYYRPRQTRFGLSVPLASAIKDVVAPDLKLFPAGLSAANWLGFTTQLPARQEFATTAMTVPRAAVGRGAIIHTGRPASWQKLDQTDAAVLDFFRRRGQDSELSAEATVRRLLVLLGEGDRFERLLKVVHDEPPRVRAMLGAAGQQLGRDSAELDRLRRTVNSLSRFDFGQLRALKYAAEWQAVERIHRVFV